MARRIFAVLVVASLPTIVTAQAGPPRSLDQLTLPSDRLHAGCRLKPLTPAPGPVRLTPAPGPFRLATNPWIGTEPPIVAMVRRRMEGSPPVPDGPPLSARAAARFYMRSADGVDGAYVATYEQPGAGEVAVYALEFASAPDASRTFNMVADDKRVIRAIYGRMVALVRNSGGANACFEALRDHMQRLR